MGFPFRHAARAAVVSAGLVLGACAVRPPAPAAPAAEVRIERIDKEFELARGVTRVAIDNPWGEINVRNRDEREVGIHAVIQRLPPTFGAAIFRTRRDGATLHIEVAFEDGATAPRPGRADIAVYLPGDLALALHTRDGRISAKQRIGTIEATSGSGSIDASTRGALSLRTGSGEIRAKAIGARWPGASDLVSDSGRVILMVPTFGDIALSAETGGRLDTDFGLSVHAGEHGMNWARARYGQGTSPLRVRSRTGEVLLEQLVLMKDDSADLEDDD